MGWWSSIYLFYLLFPVLLVSFLRSCCQIQHYEASPLCFLLSFIVLVLTFVFDLFWVNFCIWCKINAQLHSFACVYQFSQYHLLKTLSFPHWMVLHPCWKSFDHRGECIFLDCLLHSIDLCVCLYDNSTLFWLLNLCSLYSLKSGSVIPPALFFFLKIDTLPS